MRRSLAPGRGEFNRSGGILGTSRLGSLGARLLRRFVIQGDIIVLPDHRAIYLAIPKCANTSIKRVCLDLMRSDPEFAAIDSFNDPASRRKLARKGILIPRRKLDQYRGYRKFCFVRNPWDRLVSCFSQKLGDGRVRRSRRKPSRSMMGFPSLHAGMSFEQFVHAIRDIPDSEADKHFKSQHCFVTGRRNETVFSGGLRMVNAPVAG